MHSNRGALIVAIGGAALLMLFFVPLGSLALGIVGWVMSKRDLKKINAGGADNNDDVLIMIGYGLSVAATLIGGVITLVGLITLAFFASIFKAFFGQFFSFLSDFPH